MIHYFENFKWTNKKSLNENNEGDHRKVKQNQQNL